MEIEMSISPKAKKAIMLGSLCSIAYLSVYIARNVLGAVTPAMIEEGYRESLIGTFSSIYFICYAVGQLINGAIGDKIRAKWMICTGLCGAGIMNLIFSLVAATPALAMVAYGATGFFLSMIYGPMTKVVSENVEPIHATRCSLGYTFASFFGSPAAGLLAAFLAWQKVFSVSSALLVIMSVAAFAMFTLFERRKLVVYGQYKPQKKVVANIGVLFKRDIVKFTFISILTGVVRTSVVFWLPTYINQHLGFSSEDSAKIFTVATFIISFTAFIAVFIFERLGHDIDRTVLIMFTAATVFFALTYIVDAKAINLIFIVLSIMASNGAASMLWSRYCPGLRDTGMVSAATGFLDFVSYMSAATANFVFANAVTSMGWENLIIVWWGLMVCGVVVALPYKRIFKLIKRR